MWCPSSSFFQVICGMLYHVDLSNFHIFHYNLYSVNKIVAFSFENGLFSVPLKVALHYIIIVLYWGWVAQLI